MNGEQYFIKMRDGIELNTTVLEKGHDKWLICTHGVGEHSGRYDFLFAELSSSYNIVRYDLRGHGLSMGEAAYVEDFHDYILDLDEVIGHIKKRYRMEKYSLFGHSMGALITAAFMKELARETFYPDYVFLSAPPIGISGFLGKAVEYIPTKVVGLLSANPLSVKLSGLLELKHLSHNVNVASNYKNDTRNHLSLHSKLILEIIRYSRKTFVEAINIKCPGFIVVGGKDGISSCTAIEDYAGRDNTFDLKVIPEGFHELHNETEKYRKPYLEYLKQSLNVI